MSTPTLRPFQTELKAGVFREWNAGARNVVMQLATGGGKTVTLSDIVREFMAGGFACVMAHRTELVGQLSLTLARYGIRHHVVGSDAVRRNIAKLHVEELGRSYVDANAPCIVASVDTLIRADCSAWAGRVTLWVVDEGHHLVLDNKWHRAISLFTHRDVRGLLPTATPLRADGKGLGRPEIGGAGVADCMVEGPPARWLIDNKYLTDYRIIAPTTDLEMLAEVGASGDWSTQQLREAAQRSHIVGDAVKAYCKWAWGKLCIVFTTDVQTAMEMTLAFQAAGVRAECLTGKTDDYVRRMMLRKFAAREIDVIVAVDIVSEGFDLPAIEAIILARPTQSYALFAQQFGRVLRILEGKLWALVIDLAGNVIRHQGPPDKPRVWSLVSREKRGKKEDGIPYRVCPECLSPYERYHRECPYCGHYPEPAARSAPEHVDGDLAELSPEVLARLRGEAEAVDKSVAQLRSEMARDNWGPIVAGAQLKHHERRQAAQPVLRAAMALWGGRQRALGLADNAIQRAFFLRFGLSTLEAMALHAKDAEALTAKIEKVLT